MARWCNIQSSPQYRKEIRKLKKAGVSWPMPWSSSPVLADLGRSGTFSSSTSSVMAMAKMPSVSASIRPLESRMLCKDFLADMAGVLIGPFTPGFVADQFDA